MGLRASASCTGPSLSATLFIAESVPAAATVISFSSSQMALMCPSVGGRVCALPHFPRSAGAGSSPRASSAWAWLLASENATRQDLRLECWSLRSLTSNRVGRCSGPRADPIERACVRACVRPSVHPHPGSCAHAPEAAHSSLVILEGFRGLRESCYIVVTVCVGKERKHGRAWGVSAAGLEAGWETHPAPRTAVGTFAMPGTALGCPSPYLHLASLLAT